MHDPPQPTPPSGSAPQPAGDAGSRERDGALQNLLRENLAGVRGQLEVESERNGRRAPALIAVTKTVPSEVARRLFDLGCHDLAENRADPFLAKADDFAARDITPTWHFVGHLQRNKARRVLERAHVLHSVDSLRLAEAIVRLTDELERDVDVFAQVNLTGEAEKHGLRPDEVREAVTTLAAGRHVRVLGLMAMGPLAAREGRSTDDVFSDAHSLAEELTAAAPGAFVEGRCRLSMGMSGDLAAAIAHGTDYVRVGSSLFVGLEDVAPATGQPPA